MKKRTSANLLDFFKRPTLSDNHGEAAPPLPGAVNPRNLVHRTSEPDPLINRGNDENVASLEKRLRSVVKPKGQNTKTTAMASLEFLSSSDHTISSDVDAKGQGSDSRSSPDTDEENTSLQGVVAGHRSSDRSIQNGPKRKRRRTSHKGGEIISEDRDESTERCLYSKPVLDSHAVIAENGNVAVTKTQKAGAASDAPMQSSTLGEPPPFDDSSGAEKGKVCGSVSHWDFHSSISLPSVDISEVVLTSGATRADSADTLTPVPIPRKSVPAASDGLAAPNQARPLTDGWLCVQLEGSSPRNSKPDGLDEQSGGNQASAAERAGVPTATATLWIDNDEDPVDTTKEEAEEEADSAAVDVNSKLGKQILAEAKKRVGGASNAVAPGSLFSKMPSVFIADMASPSFDPALFDATPYLADINNQVLQLAASQLPIIRDFPNQRRILKFCLVAETFDAIESLKGSGGGSKKKSVVLLTNLLRLSLFLSPIDFFPIVYFCFNRVAPEYSGLELGVGEGILIKIVTEVFARAEKSIKADLAKYEDLGRVAQLSRANMKILCKPAPLTMLAVFAELRSLADCTGSNSQQRKKDKIKRILVAAEKAEPKYIIRFLESKMRTGVQKATLIQALAFAFVLTPCRLTCPNGDQHDSANSEQHRKLTTESDLRRSIRKTLLNETMEDRLTNMENAVRQALCEVPNFEIIGKHLLNGCTPQGLADACTVTPGVPVQPMLAKPTKGIQEVFDRFSGKKFTAEFKYDGERSQIHILADSSIMVYSRNLEHLTVKYPDVLEIIKSTVNSNVTSCILDCEVVAMNPETLEILPFQVLSTRKRKLIDNQKSQVNVCIFPFDCIHFNGENLIRLPLSKRREFLHKCVRESPGKLQFATSSEVTTVEEVDAFLQEAIEASCEGLMIKTLDESASYEPSQRSLNWLKIKKDYLENMTDSVDLVPIGAYNGRGKRSKVFGAYLLACYNDEDEVFQSVCRAGTGFVDSILKSLYEQLSDTVATVKPVNYSVDPKLTPDVWLSPRYVWEIRAADLSVSPVHTAAKGLIKLDKGIGLRFPRFIRDRNDKSPEQATTATQIAEMYHAQFSLPAKTLQDDHLSPHDSPSPSPVDPND